MEATGPESQMWFVGFDHQMGMVLIPPPPPKKTTTTTTQSCVFLKGNHNRGYYFDGFWVVKVRNFNPPLRG